MGAKLAGSGGSKYSLGQNSDLNVTPFVDILLVLLIIFMVAVPMATVSIKLDLPPAVPPPPGAKPKEPTFISISKTGDLFIGGNATSLDRLGADLSAKIDRNEAVFIRADREVHYKDFMGVVNQLQTDGFYKVALINENLNG